MITQRPDADDAGEHSTAGSAVLSPAAVAAVTSACRRFGVSHLDVFGSAVTQRFDPARSDVDFLVEFLPGSATLDNYFGLRESLEESLGRPVDLVSPQALRNPYFASTVAETRRELYAA